MPIQEVSYRCCNKATEGIAKSKGVICMRLSGMDSSSVSMLFSSLGSGSRNSGGMDMLGINYSDYASIRSGAYGRLLKSYYAMDSDSSKKASSTTQTKKTSSATSKDSAKVLANIEDSAGALAATAKDLYSRSNNKVFSKDTKGNYDASKIYDKISDFVEDYNDLLTTAGKSGVSRIKSSLSSMKNITDRREDKLNEIGISVDSENGALSIDKDTFMKADMNKVKELFNGTGSYAYSVATQASMIDASAQSEAAKANTYGSAGKYNYNYNSGSIFADYF